LSLFVIICSMRDLVLSLSIFYSIAIPANRLVAKSSRNNVDFM
jgi:hypothetical protein